MQRKGRVSSKLASRNMRRRYDIPVELYASTTSLSMPVPMSPRHLTIYCTFFVAVPLSFHSLNSRVIYQS